ncbi:MAG TPA: RagB/SusD family nutrient uptake outer membrane protein [Gemmatimonadales bacterium]|nr:RagB/SusD family nutrient uptake outer membrane protein [Gemmatimonadales bacterium]
MTSAVGDFECAYGNFSAAVANVTDEYLGSGAAAGNNLWDLRNPTVMDRYTTQGHSCALLSSAPSDPIYAPLQTARYSADDTYARIQAWAAAGDPIPNKTVLLSILAAYAGYTYTMFGETFCRSAFDLGPPLQWRDVLAIAEQRFTTVLSLDTVPGDSIRFMALLGRARVRLDLGRLADADADAQLVPPPFLKNATYSTDSPRRMNQVYQWNAGTQYSTVDPRFRNLSVGAVADPRVKVLDSGHNGQDGRTRLWLAAKYPTAASPIPIASWDEAQLIMAEAEGGQGAVDAINRLRTKYGLPLFSSANPDTIVRQIADERRRTLFLDGHRLGDWLRDSIADSLQFDHGTNAKGNVYGPMTCFPLPQVEILANPHCANDQCSAMTR